MPWTPADDQRHDVEPDAPDWSERWSFAFIDPRHQLCCTTRVALLPNAGRTVVTVALSRQGRPLYHRYLDRFELPEGDVLAGMGTAGFRFRALSLPRSRFLLSFADPGSAFTFDVDWQGLHEPVDAMDMHSSTSSSGLYGMRVEQAGRIVGRLTLQKRTIDLVGIGTRRHAVTESDWETTRPWESAIVSLDDGRAFGLGQVKHGSGMLQVPWVWDREKLVPLSRLRIDRSSDDAGRTAALQLRATDAANRTYLLEGTRRTSIVCFADAYSFEAGYYDFVLDDGGRGVGTYETGAALVDA